MNLKEPDFAFDKPFIYYASAALNLFISIPVILGRIYELLPVFWCVGLTFWIMTIFVGNLKEVTA